MRFDLVGAITEHTLDDDWWRERSPFWRLGDIKVPVLSIGHWGKMGLHLRGNILGFEEVKAPKKLVVTGAKNVHEAHHQFDQVEFHEKELLPFYDLHLKGIEQRLHGRRAGAPVRARRRRLARGGRMAARRARATCRYYLRKGPSGSVTSLNDGGLSTEPPAADEAATRYTYPDWEWTNGVVANGPGRTARPGAARAHLHLGAARGRSRGHRADRAQALRVIGPDRHPLHRQARRPAAAGRGRARKGRAARRPPMSRRAGSRPRTARRTQSRSTELRPFYTHTNPQPLTPGEIYQFDIEVLPIAYVFKQGHRIRLEIANGDSPLTDAVFTHPYHPTLIGTDTIHHDARASRRASCCRW